MKGGPRFSKWLSEFEKAKKIATSLSDDGSVCDSVEEIGDLIEELNRDPYFRFNGRLSLDILKERYDEVRNFVKDGKHTSVAGTFEFWSKMVELEQKRSRLDRKRRGNK